jgi:uncharacterized protein YneR
MYEDKGRVAELEFAKECIKRDMVVSRPIVGAEKYDYILDNRKKLLRIQVKSTKNFSEKNSRFKVNVAYGNSIKKIYTKKDIDFFAVYIEEYDIWYFIPVEEVGVKTLNLYPHRKSEGTFETYKNNWSLIS